MWSVSITLTWGVAQFNKCLQASQWVWLDCGCGLFVSMLAHYCVCVRDVAHLGNLTSVSIVVASQWVWLKF